MVKPDTVKIRCIIGKCYIAGESLSKGKTCNASPSDARLLVGLNQCEYVESAPTPPSKGLSSESVKAK